MKAELIWAVLSENPRASNYEIRMNLRAAGVQVSASYVSSMLARWHERRALGN